MSTLLAMPPKHSDYLWGLLTRTLSIQLRETKTQTHSPTLSLHSPDEALARFTRSLLIRLNVWPLSGLQQPQRWQWKQDQKDLMIDHKISHALQCTQRPDEGRQSPTVACESIQSMALFLSAGLSSVHALVQQLPTAPSVSLCSPQGSSSASSDHQRLPSNPASGLQSAALWNDKVNQINKQKKKLISITFYGHYWPIKSTPAISGLRFSLELWLNMHHYHRWGRWDT